MHLTSWSMMRCTSLVSRSKPFSTVNDRSFRARSVGNPAGPTDQPLYTSEDSAPGEVIGGRERERESERLTARPLRVRPVGARPVVLRLDADNVVLDRPVGRDPRVEVVRVVHQG